MAHRVAPGKARDEVEFALKYRQPPAFVSSEQHTLWHAWVGGIEAKPLRFDARTGTLTVALRCTEDATLPTHRHKGVATAVTIKGSWKFDDYDWSAGPGDFAVENGGTVHAMHLKAGTEVVFTANGSLEFLNEDGAVNEAVDLFAFAKMYYDHCAKEGVKPNDSLWF